MTDGDDRVPTMLGEVVTTQAEWIGRFMGLANDVAGWSKDPDRQVGAIVAVDKGRSLSPGYNGFPEGVADLQQRIKGPEKAKLTIHAEVNALNNARFDVTAGTMYVTTFPCLACALQIISRRIAHVIAPKPEAGSRWFDTQQEALGILQEARVRITFVEVADGPAG